MSGENFISRKDAVDTVYNGVWELWVEHNCKEPLKSNYYRSFLSLTEAGTLQDNNLFLRASIGGRPLQDVPNYPLFDIKITFNPEFDRLFELKLIYYEECNYDFLKPILYCVIRRSVSGLRYWYPINKFFINYTRTMDRFSSFQLLVRFAIKDLVNVMRDNGNSVLSKRGVPYDEIRSFSDNISGMAIDYYYNEFNKKVQIDYDLFMKQISNERARLLESKERAASMINSLKNDDIFYYISDSSKELIACDVERYFNSNLRLLDKDEAALAKYKKLGGKKLERILEHLNDVDE